MTYQVAQSNFVELNINNAKSWALAIDDVDKTQSDLNLMNIFTAAAAEDMRVAVDGTVLTGIINLAAVANQGNTAGLISGNLALGAATVPVAVTELTVVAYILRLGQALDEQNAPETGRFLVIPSAMAALLKDSPLKEVQITGDGTSIARNGKLGMIDRFTVYSSNNLPIGVGVGAGPGGMSAGENVVYAGVPSATAFASQIVKNETLPNPDSFGELMRGLQVFGFSVVKPEGLAQGVVTLAHT